MKSLALATIRFYQRFLSPHKGFCCAYAAISGRGSCSALGYRAIQRYGVWRGIAVLDKRLEKCGVAHRFHGRRNAAGPLKHQGGFIDCGCDVPSGCDLPCDSPAGCGKSRMAGLFRDLPGDCGCDCDWRRRKKKPDEDVVVPVRSNTIRRGTASQADSQP